jgi:hypothetical protein
MHFYATGKGVMFGPDGSELKEVPDFNEGYLSTIDVPVTMPGGYDTDAQINIMIQEPLPMFLAMISYDVEPGD